MKKSNQKNTVLDIEDNSFEIIPQLGGIIVYPHLESPITISYNTWKKVYEYITEQEENEYLMFIDKEKREVEEEEESKQFSSPQTVHVTYEADEKTLEEEEW